MSSTTTPVGYRAERFVAPAEQTFKLPDGSSVNSVDAEGVITVTGDNSVITFAPQERVVRVSPYGIVNDDRAVSEAALLISSTTPVTTRDLWVSVYALWLRRNEEDVVPVVIDEKLSNAGELQNYFTHTGWDMYQMPPIQRLSFSLVQRSGRVRVHPVDYPGCAILSHHRRWLRCHHSFLTCSLSPVALTS